MQVKSPEAENNYFSECGPQNLWGPLRLDTPKSGLVLLLLLLLFLTLGIKALLLLLLLLLLASL